MMARTYEELKNRLDEQMNEHDINVKAKREGAIEAIDSVDSVLDLFLKKVNEVESGNVFTITSVSKELMEHRELLMLKVPTEFDMGFEVTIDRNSGINTTPIYDFRVYTEEYMYSIDEYDGTYRVEATPLKGVALNIGQIGSKG